MLKSLLIVSMCINATYCSEAKKEDIVLGKIGHKESLSGDSLSDGHHNHWGTEHHTYNEQHREHLPDHLIHHASTSIVSQRANRGVVDLPGVPRVISDDSPSDGTVVNVAATIAVKTESECCNSRCCIDEDTTCKCIIQ